MSDLLLMPGRTPSAIDPESEIVMSPKLLHFCAGCDALTSGAEYCERCHEEILCLRSGPFSNDLWPLVTREDVAWMLHAGARVWVVNFFGVLTLIALVYALCFL